MDRQVFWKTNYLCLSEVFFQPSCKSNFLPYLAFLVFKIYKNQNSNKMIEKKEDNIRSESYYPDSSYYLDQENTPQETPLSEDQMSSMTKFEWPNSYWFIAERTNGRLAMIGFMAVIINYTLFGWIAYPIL